MKRLLLLTLIIITAVVIYNCDDAGVSKNDETTTSVSGTITGWTLGDKILKARVKDSSQTNIFLADSTTINSGGSFTASLKVPPDNFMWTYTIPPTGTSCSGNFNISPANLKNTTVEFRVYDLSNNQLGTLQKKNFSGPVPSNNSFVLSYVYFDNNASVLGTRTCTSLTDTIIVTANYNGNKGWNPVITLWNSFSVTRQDIRVSSSEPPGGAWYYIP